VHRLVLDGRDIDRGEIAGAQQAREFDSIPSVGLDLVAGSFRDQGGCDDAALQPLPSQVAMKHVPARTGLVGELQVRGFALESADELVDVRLPGPDGSDEVRGIGPVGLGVGDADRVLVNVQSDEKCGRLLHG